MQIDVSEFLDALDDDQFDETPVDVKTFVEDSNYLGIPPLSEYQYVMVECMSQIYKEKDLIKIMGPYEGKTHYDKYTRNEIILQLGKGCHAPYTKVFNPNLGKWEDLSSMKEGMVATKKGNEYATESFFEGVGQMVRVKTSLGFKEDVYIGHKYLWMKKNKFYKRLRDNNQGSFEEIKNISIGDRIAIGLNMQPENPINIPEEHAELIGYWLGNGMLPSNENPIINMDFSSEEHESIENYLKLCHLIGDEPTKRIHKNKKMISFIHGRNSVSVQLARKYGIWGLRSKTKFIPDAVWKSDNKIFAKTIARLWQTDGCIYKKNGMIAEYVSVSQQLAEDMHRGLLRLGIPSTIRSKVPSSNFPNASMAYYVTVGSQECFNVFAEKIELLDHKRAIKLNKNGRIYARIDENIYWDKVVSIEPIGEGEYWTRTVPDSGHYIGNGFISANSGKDHCSTVGCAYLVYKLLCLKDPSRYFGKPTGDAIDIMNVAINAQQAKNVFFKGLRSKIENSPWFSSKFIAKIDSIEFDKSITVYSGHSERESHEGLNLILAVLDEISGFAVDSVTTGDRSKTSNNLYRAFRGSVDSRFPDYGKIVMLSFPRHKDDFISMVYEDCIAEKNIQIRKHKFVLNKDLPEDDPENSFEISWEEDNIISYKYPGVFALKRPTWDINPLRSIEDFKVSFYRDINDSLMRFACMPTESSDTFFKSREKLEKCLSLVNPVSDKRIFNTSFAPDPNALYFAHADLAQKHDKCAVAVSHVEKWVEISVFNNYHQVVPFVVVDAIAWWEPRKEGPVDLSDVKNWIFNLRRMGFNLQLVTFDRWHCLPGHALVHTTNGPVRMKDIREGDEVMTRFGKATVGSKMETGEQEVFRITTRLGYEFEGTANHQMLTKRGWKTISELTNDDELLRVSENNELWIKIRKIESVGSMPTYDIYVPEYNEFIANGFVTHNSFDIQRDLKDLGIKTDTLSVAKKHYEDLAMLFYEERIAAPHLSELLNELLQLRITDKNKVDHPRKGGKDLSDALCGAVYNAISLSKKDNDQEVNIHTWSSIKEDRMIQSSEEEEEKENVYGDIKEFLFQYKLI